MHCQNLVMNTFKSICNVNQMHVLPIIILPKDCLHGKQILNITAKKKTNNSQFLIITKQLNTCVLTFQKQNNGFQRV